MIGDWSMVPKGLAAILAKIMFLTKDNTEGVLNLAFAYTGRNEITRTAIELKEGVSRGDLKVDDLSVKLMDETLKISSTQSPPDLLIRTSGVTRLSDFLIWQSTFAILHFVDVLWPELTFWDIWKAMFQYQVQYFRMQKYKILPAQIEKNNNSTEINERGHVFLEKVEEKYWDDIKVHADTL
jgi:ditrans,polycis-polyprenyl diphosphate synthase